MNPEHHHTFLQWLNHHFAVISLIYFPAFCGYLNGFIAFLKVWGFTQAAEFCGKLEDSLKAFIDATRASKQTEGKP